MRSRLAALALSHGLAAAGGFALGIYLLPILTAPDAPPAEAVMAEAGQASFKGEFRRDLKDSDALHWGEGSVSVSPRTISLLGKIAPGPAYKLYLSPSFVETEAEFLRLKGSRGQRPRALHHGDRLVRGLQPVHHCGEVSVAGGKQERRP
jgi:hypothetical protein